MSKQGFDQDDDGLKYIFEITQFVSYSLYATIDEDKETNKKIFAAFLNHKTDSVKQMSNTASVTQMNSNVKLGITRLLAKFEQKILDTQKYDTVYNHNMILTVATSKIVSNTSVMVVTTFFNTNSDMMSTIFSLIKLIKDQLVSMRKEFVDFKLLTKKQISNLVSAIDELTNIFQPYIN